jgi:phosphatidylserine decarboxylase
VGAIFVSSIETTWAGTITPPRGKKIQTWNYSNAEIKLNKGDDLGRFNMGSTAIVLFPKDTINWTESIQAESKIQMGQCLGSFQK